MLKHGDELNSISCLQFSGKALFYFGVQINICFSFTSHLASRSPNTTYMKGQMIPRNKIFRTSPALSQTTRRLVLTKDFLRAKTLGPQFALIWLVSISAGMWRGWKSGTSRVLFSAQPPAKFFLIILTVLTSATGILFLTLREDGQFIAEGPGGPGFGTLLYHRHLLCGYYYDGQLPSAYIFCL